MKNKKQPTRDEVVEHGKYLGAVVYESGATEQRWEINCIVFAETCNAAGCKTSWRCVGKNK